MNRPNVFIDGGGQLVLALEKESDWMQLKGCMGAEFTLVDHLNEMVGEINRREERRQQALLHYATHWEA